MKPILAVCAFAIVVSGIPAMFPQRAEAADNELFQQMDIGFFSIGGRASYYDPQEGQSRWFGGAQVRVNPFKYLSFEGSQPIIGKKIQRDRAFTSTPCRSPR